MHATRDRGQPVRPVVDGVHAGHHGEQHLRGADVRRRLLAADVLLARLQREPVRVAAVRVDGDADEAARHRALEFVARREVSGVRAAVAHRHAEALRRADGDVGAPFAGRSEQRQREQVGGDDHEPATRVHGGDERRVVADIAVPAGILQQHRERARVRGVRRRTDDDVEPERLRARAHDVDRLREDVVGDEETRASAPPDAVAERHRLGGGGRLVQHRGVGDRHPGQIADHRLEVDERFEAPLRDLGLVRRVRGVPRRILEDIAEDDARHVRAVVALADERLQHAVPAGDRLQSRERVGLADRAGERQLLPAANRGGHDRVHQRRARRVAQRGEHRRLVLRRRADVARDERVVPARARPASARRRRGRIGGRSWRGLSHGRAAAGPARGVERRARHASPIVASYARASSSVAVPAASAGFIRKNHVA